MSTVRCKDHGLWRTDDDVCPYCTIADLRAKLEAEKALRLSLVEQYRRLEHLIAAAAFIDNGQA